MGRRLRVRQPRQGEAAELAKIHVATWKEAYQGLLPERLWNDQALAGRIRMWSDVIAAEEHRSRARIAQIDGGTVGIAMAETPRDDDGEATVELFLMYVLAEHYGSGAADVFLTELLGDDAAASLWVIKDNPRAQAFYRKHGFKPDGAEKDLGVEEHADDLDGICEIRMVRKAPTGAEAADA